MPDRGLLATLSPHEEVTLRRVALGIAQPRELPAKDVERLNLQAGWLRISKAACSASVELSEAVTSRPRCRRGTTGRPMIRQSPAGTACDGVH